MDDRTPRSNRSRAWRVLAPIAIAFTAAVGVAAPSSADDPERFVALGDSYAAGSLAGLPYDLNLLCGRTVSSYNVSFADDHDVASFDFDACGGATTATLLSGQLTHLDAATTLVSVSIGGNDFPTFMPACQSILGIADVPGCASAAATKVAEIEAGLPDLLDDTYQTIQLLAPNARIIVLNYPHVYNETITSCSEMVQANRVQVNNVFTAIREVVADRAAANGLEIADPDALFEGHRLCDPDPYMVTTVPALRGHPDADGNELAMLPAFEAAH